MLVHACWPLIPKFYCSKFNLHLVLSFTILVPGEAISELLTLILHIQTDGNKLFLLISIVMDTSWISVIKTENHQNTDSHITIYNRCKIKLIKKNQNYMVHVHGIEYSLPDLNLKYMYM